MISEPSQVQKGLNGKPSVSPSPPPHPLLRGSPLSFKLGCSGVYLHVLHVAFQQVGRVQQISIGLRELGLHF